MVLAFCCITSNIDNDTSNIDNRRRIRDRNRVAAGCVKVGMLGRVRCGTAAVAAIVCIAHARGEQGQTIRVPVRLVSVPTLVVSKDGKYVPGLSVGDFRVTDNDRPQAITLDLGRLPASLVVAVQANQDVRAYLAPIAKTGALLDDSLAGATGETALITYNDEINVEKPFASGDLQSALKMLSPSGRGANMADAGMRAIELLKERPGPRSRILVFIGQAVDSGNTKAVETLAVHAERDNVQIYALTLPIVGRTFVSDSFRLQGFGSQGYRGGYEASVELTKAVPALRRLGHASTHTDAFSLLTAATGGIQLHFRRQQQLENAIIGLGDALRSRYFLSYRPDRYDSGFHKIVVHVDVPGATVYARPGYPVTDQ
jgi:VWFA-related protein